MGRERQTLGDYLAIAISPALIMALVGSLVFFLVEVLYAGRYEGRLRWMLFCFVFGAVLIARISMNDEIAERAKLYGLALGAAVYVALLRFVTFPEGTILAPFAWAINLGLMVIIWWCAHRLTWDCTWIDDDTKASGAGLLEAAGLDPEAPPTDEARTKKKPKKPSAPQFGLMRWWDRYQAYREAQAQRPRNPGVWVVYFSLAALPLFGLGQTLIPPADADRRRYVFWLMGVYVASGLGLLLSTCYLGLRRYLRQRKLRMPAAMTGLWLLMGGGLIVALLVIATLLPRPNAEYAVIHLKSLAGSKERSASRNAMKGDSPTKGEGSRSNQRSEDQKQAKDGKGGNRDDQAQNQRGGKGKGNDKSGQKAQGKGQSKGKQGDSGKGSQEQQREQKTGPSGSTDPDDQRSKDTSDSGSTESQSSPLLSHLGKAGTILKWVSFGIVAAVVLFFVLRSGLKWLANFTDWARR
ncbi:MAG TPA: hypothetical protein VFA18_04695, partial [Gemmataceae bacterium]|nr:hypothetical protein [Gemmataceae bacterium]